MNEIKAQTLSFKKPVGEYTLMLGEGSRITIPVYEKPKFIHKFFMKKFFGIEYSSNPDNKNK